MAEIPERIWAETKWSIAALATRQVGIWDQHEVKGATEYVLASTHQRTLEALKAAAGMRREVTTEYDGRTYLECSCCGCSLSEDEPHDADCAWPVIDAALRAKGGEHGVS